MTHRLTYTAITLGSVFLWAMSWAQSGMGAMPLKAPSASSAEPHIARGIEQYNKGHWARAKKHFARAAKIDPASAEAHYDLALALDKLNDHVRAKGHFKKAYELGKTNAEIQGSDVLKKHLGL